MNASPLNGTAYYIGQRVIVDGTEIAMVVRKPHTQMGNYEGRVWVKFVDGVVQWRDKVNVRPLPNGEL